MNLEYCLMYKLRKASMGDAKLLFDWANDEEVRATAIMKKKIEWNEHINWLTNKLQDNQCYIYILTDDKNESFGVVRFERDIDAFSISYSIDRLYRKKGIGQLIMQLGIERMREIIPRCKFKASVQEDNIASNRIFEKLGFKLEGTKMVERHVFNIYRNNGNE